MSTNNSNNSAEIIVKGSTFQEKVGEEDNYPDPNTLPSPSQEQRIADVTLSELLQENISLLLHELYTYEPLKNRMLLDQR